MRVAISGAHATGKSTLVADLARELPGHVLVEELYHTMQADGYDFPAEPTADDFELMLERSMAVLRETRSRDAIFDRCPVDYLGYLAAIGERDREALGAWLADVTSAVSSLDLVIFVPIEQPDRIDVPASEGRRLRRRVDAVLRDMLLEDAWGLGAPVIEVSGPPADRVHQVLAHAHQLQIR